MKAYLVGGAVRDQLLGLPVVERDWVVVGSTPDELCKKGYKKVGRDFPVFLHPTTREEYALARTERKHGDGYYGFVCDFNPKVRLEEDLSRRDLTINAIAMDDEGKLIDPYHGYDDLRLKILRHVSQAFVEDPVRVLRCARFAARFYHLGFKVADETRALMYNMVKAHNLADLVAERVCQEWLRSLHEPNPDIFITTLRSCGALKAILPELDALFGVPNAPNYHPEIDTGVHTLMTLRMATVLTPDPIVRFAALLHDVGKACTPISEWPKHKGHDARGLLVINALCQRLRIPVDYRNAALLACKFHSIIHRLDRLDATSIVTTLEQVDAFRRPELFDILLCVCEADALGVAREIIYIQGPRWRNLLNECTKINAKTLIEQGIHGAQIKTCLHDLRIARITTILNTWNSHEKQ